MGFQPEILLFSSFIITKHGEQLSTLGTKGIGPSQVQNRFKIVQAIDSK